MILFIAHALLNLSCHSNVPHSAFSDYSYLTLSVGISVCRFFVCSLACTLSACKCTDDDRCTFTPVLTLLVRH